MKLAAARAAERRSKASYVSVSSETDLPRVIAEGPSRVVVHFALEGCDESARVDGADVLAAAAHPRTRFVRVLGAWPSPMLNTVGAHCLPAIVCFRRKKLGRWTAGFDDFGGVEGFEESRVARWLARAADMLPGHPDAPKDATRDAAGIGLGDESSDDEERGGGGRVGRETRGRGAMTKNMRGFAPCGEYAVGDIRTRTCERCVEGGCSATARARTNRTTRRNDGVPSCERRTSETVVYSSRADVRFATAKDSTPSSSILLVACVADVSALSSPPRATPTPPPWFASHTLACRWRNPPRASPFPGGCSSVTSSHPPRPQGTRR